jgi:hypothetical protein
MKNYLQTGAFFERNVWSSGCGPVSVRRGANAPGDGAHEKDLQIAAFSERLKGFEPSTFCMASSCSAPADRS